MNATDPTTAAGATIEHARSTWEGRRVVVVGAGRSGVAAAHLLVDCGARVTITDLRHAAELGEAADLGRRGVRVESGAHPPEIWESADVAVFSPGITPSAPVFQQARAAGVRIIAEIELAASLVTAPIIAITGSNGKSTVTSMVGSIFAAAGRPAAVCGNIGTAFSTAVRNQLVDGVEYDAFVVEISSFQAHAIETFHPQIAAILNLQADHLDWHGSMDRYATAKLRLTLRMNDNDWLVYNLADAELRGRVTEVGADRDVRLVPFARHPAQPRPPLAWVDSRQISWWPAGGSRQPLMRLEELPVIGPHNQDNACAAAAVATLAGIEPAAVAAGLRDYLPLEHRMESCGEIGGIRCINDSKATNVDAAAAALSGFEGGVWLILGGRDKGADFSRLRPLITSRVETVLLIGEAAGDIGAALASTVPLQSCGTLERAVDHALEKATPGHTLLLSPACTSFDQYPDFEARGRHFKQLVAGGAETPSDNPAPPDSPEET